jgi:hypothetical protein
VARGHEAATIHLQVIPRLACSTSTEYKGGNGMKAYFLSIRDDDMDQGGFTVFANNVQEARKQADSKDLQYERWIDIQAHRSPLYDGMENLSEVELCKLQWREGWNWVDRYDMPDPDEATDDDFYKWYEGNFGAKL